MVLDAGLMCNDCPVQCTKAMELIDCFTTTLQLRGFIRTSSNGTEKMIINDKIYDCLEIIKDECPYFFQKTKN